MEKSKNLILDVDEFPQKKGQAIILAIQHVLAMFVACVTVPLIVYGGITVNFGGQNLPLTSLMLAPTLVSAGLGTIFYLVVTKFRSPIFLASSFAYMTAMSEAIKVDAIINNGVFSTINLWILPVGMLMVCAVYCLVALLIKVFGVNWLNKLLPPIVVGPVIMVIGLSLAGSAISNLTTATGSGQAYNWCALLSGLVAMIVTALCAHYGKKTLSLIPFLVGMGAGYVFAAILTGIGYYGFHNDYFHVIDFTPLTSLFSNVTVQSFIDYPKFLFLVGAQSETVVPLTWSAVGQAALIFVPVSLVTICEHIGDHKNMSGILERDLLQDPGLSRTLIGDGVATGLSGILCGAANTTYGENTGVLALSRVYDPRVIRIAALFAIGLSFIPKFSAIISTMPTAIIGGISFILYGMISAIGVRNIVDNKVDLSKSRNLIIAAIIFVCGLGFKDGFTFTVFGTSITLTSLAIAAIAGIVLNAVLPGNKYTFQMAMAENSEETNKGN